MIYIIKNNVVFIPNLSHKNLQMIFECFSAYLFYIFALLQMNN